MKIESEVVYLAGIGSEVVYLAGIGSEVVYLVGTGQCTGAPTLLTGYFLYVVGEFQNNAFK
jgi:hypothetical protein